MKHKIIKIKLPKQYFPKKTGEWIISVEDECFYMEVEVGKTDFPLEIARRHGII